MSGILGIENRTENWKTTVYCSPMFGWESHRLAAMLGATPELLPGEVRLELFGKGVRDYRYQKGLSRRELEVRVVKSFNQSFHNLRRDVLASQEFQELQDDHYVLSGDSAAGRLTNNLLGTEIDVVLETPAICLSGKSNMSPL